MFQHRVGQQLWNNRLALNPIQCELIFTKWHSWCPGDSPHCNGRVSLLTLTTPPPLTGGADYEPRF